MVAAMTTLDIVAAQGVQQHVESLGEMLIGGLNAIAKECGCKAIAYGEPVASMPFFRFDYSDADVNLRLTRRLFREVLAAGILLHPRHMWFISQSHTLEDIARTLEVVRLSLKRTLGVVRPSE